MGTKYKWFVGIDWGGEHHQICILDEDRRRVGERSIDHSGEGLAELVTWLQEIVAGEPATMAAAIEVPHGVLVETLLAHGFHVLSLNPKQLSRFRDRHSVGGAKDDRRDAFVLATSVITDFTSFRRLHVETPFVLRLRELSRAAESLEREHRRLCNQLRDLLFRYFPAVLKLSSAADEAWIWSLLAIAPLPEEAAGLKPGQIQDILKVHRIRRFTAAQVAEQLQRKAFSLAPGAAESIAEHVSVLVPLLQAFREQRKKVARTLEELLAEGQRDERLEEHTTVNLLLSLPGVGVTVATTLLSEAGRALAELDCESLRCHSGVAPVTKQSGKSRWVIMRHGCNDRLREACYHWARVSAQRDAASRAHYGRLRKAGHRHGRTLRGVSDRLLSVLFAMLRSNKPYDPTLRSDPVRTLVES
jgi:transposase